MSIIGIGTVISKDNLDKFYNSLIKELNRSKEIYRTDDVISSAREGFFRFINKKKNLCYEARLIAIDNTQDSEYVFVSYDYGVIRFAESIQTIREIEFCPYKKRNYC